MVMPIVTSPRLNGGPSISSRPRPSYIRGQCLSEQGLACIKCGGKMKIISAIEDPRVIRKILEHMGLDTKPPPLHPARGPPKVQHHFEDDFTQQHFDMNFDNFNQSAD
jgi:hypothetical protein